MRRPPVDDGRAHPLRRARVAAAARPLAARALGGGGGGGGGGVGSDEALHARQDRVALAVAVVAVGVVAVGGARLLGLGDHHHRPLEARDECLRLVLRLAARDGADAILAELLDKGAFELRAAALPAAVAPAVVLAGGARHRRLPRLRLAQRAAHLGEHILEEELDGEPLGAED